MTDLVYYEGEPVYTNDVDKWVVFEHTTLATDVGFGDWPCEAVSSTDGPAPAVLAVSDTPSDWDAAIRLPEDTVEGRDEPTATTPAGKKRKSEPRKHLILDGMSSV